VQLRDEELPKDVQESNWFSAPSALRVYGQYLNLDKDHNGMLSKEELSRYFGVTLLQFVLVQWHVYSSHLSINLHMLFLVVRHLLMQEEGYGYSA